MKFPILPIIAVLTISGCQSTTTINSGLENSSSLPFPNSVSSLPRLTHYSPPVMSPGTLIPHEGESRSQKEDQLDPFPTVYFRFNSWEIKHDVQERLDATAEWMNRFPGYKITIEGHTDIRGTESYNMVLGVRRAKAVKEYLTKLGIPNTRLDTVSYGKTLVLCEIDDEHACHQFNRRADLLLE